MTQKLRSIFDQLRHALDPWHSLRARMALTFGLVVILLAVVLVVFLELTVVDETTNPTALISNLERLIWIAGLVLSIVFSVSAWFIAGRIIRPLEIMADAAREQLENGREQVIPTFPGQDEIASLSRSLNILVASLRTQQAALRQVNDQLEQRVSQRTRQLATLYDVLEIGSEKDALPALLNRALTRILSESSATTGCIHLIEPDGQQLVMMAHFQMNDQVVATFGHISIDHPVVQNTLHQESYWLMDNAQTATYDPNITRLMDQRNILCLPIRRGGHNQGILSVFAPKPVLFPEDEIDLLASLADQLGIIIENDRLQQQAERLTLVEERNRMARDLHDSVTQALYSATLFAEAGQKQARAGNVEKALTYLDEVLDTSRQALKEIRLLVHKLRPSPLEKEGLLQALDHRLKAVEGRAGIEQKLVVNGSPVLTTEIEEALYHIAVEALNNALKHSQATAVSVSIAQTDSAVTLQVIDNGQGFDMEEAASSGGLGLTSMQERASMLNGTITIDSMRTQGTSVTAVLPVSQTVKKDEPNE